MFTGEELVFDPLRRSKMIVRTSMDGIHDVLNHDLAEHLPPQCRLAGSNGFAYQLHMLNLRPGSKQPTISNHIESYRIMFLNHVIIVYYGTTVLLLYVQMNMRRQTSLAPWKIN